MKKMLCCLLLCLALVPLWGQKTRKVIPNLREGYELEKNLPVYLDRIKANLTFPMARGNSPVRSYDKWRKAARAKTLECLLTPPPRTDFDMEMVAVEQREGYRAMKIRFNVSAYARIPAYLLMPEGDGPFPAIVMLHDHGGRFDIGKEKMVRPFGENEAVTESAKQWARQCYDNVYIGDYFAAQGYAVIAIDALYWGERSRKEGFEGESQQALACNLEQLGMTWSGTITYDDMATTELLASLPAVDKNRIGALGFSMGGHRAWMLAAMTDRIAAAACISWMNTTEYLMTVSNNQNRGQSAFSMAVPNLRNYLDYPHVASIACPKPMLFFTGEEDHLFPRRGSEDAFTIMRKVWEGQKAGDRLVTKLWPGGHFFSHRMQEETLQFFHDQMNGR